MGDLVQSRTGVRTVRQGVEDEWWAVGVFVLLGVKFSGNVFVGEGICVPESEGERCWLVDFP